MTKTDRAPAPANDRPLTAGDVPLLREGDVLRCTLPGGSFSEGEEVAFVRAAPRETGRIYLLDRDYHPFLCDRFTFVARPATSAASEGADVAQRLADAMAAHLHGSPGNFEIAIHALDEHERALRAILAALASPPVSERERELEGALKLAKERIQSWPIDDHETCMCGSLVEGHDIGSGHSPVSQADHAVSIIVQEIDRALTAQPAGEGKTHG